MISRLLPGYNCGECGCRSCREFAEAVKFPADLSLCPFMGQERYEENRAKIEEQLSSQGPAEKITGVLDGLEAEFALAPLPGDASCREDLYPFDREVNLEKGDLIRYRPLGCPVTHFAKVQDYEHGVATVQMVGPLHLLGSSVKYKELGICMVAAFEGLVSRGRVPEVGKTVRFLPEHCMMQKVHSGVVVHSEGRRVRIEGIDLKVW
jgi:uncharacterized Fe-S cluster-containing protein